MRIAVLGLGGVGTAAARFLAAAGHSVVGFEQFRLDHDRGSSYGGSRIIRRVYPDSFYVSLMNAAYPLWEALERESDESLLVKCGGLFFGPRDHPEMTGMEQALGEAGVPYQRWTAEESHANYPQFRLTPDEYAFLEPESGFLRASRCVLANARLARAAGAELREEAAVTTLEATAAGLRLRVGGGWETFDRVVVVAGPWTRPLLAPWIDPPLTVTRQQYAHFGIRGDRAAFAPDRFPVWIDAASYFYGFPENEDHPGAKVAQHIPGPSHDPNSADRQPREVDTETLREYLARRLPALSGEVTLEKVCLYTMTPDEDFLLDRLPGEPRVLYCGGLSGHGFKFTVLLGWLLARLTQDLDPGHDLTRFSLRRFSS
jgi:monomeric sarcosine oxidase